MPVGEPQLGARIWALRVIDGAGNDLLNRGAQPFQLLE
jgi:hypothetical protein